MMNLLLVSTQDYLHHPIPSRHHNIFERLAAWHDIHVPHFHVSHGPARNTLLHVHEATRFPVKTPVLHYTLNAPHHYRVMREIIRDHDIDIVVGAHVLAGTAMVRAARQANIPVVFDLKDWFPDSAAAYATNPVIKRVVHDGVLAVTRYNLKHSDVITTVSPGLVAKLHGYGYEAELITNGVNTDLFRPRDGSRVREALGIDPDAFVLGFAGAVERWYALDEVIRALPRIVERHPNVELLIVGDALFTGYRETLHRLAATCGIASRVHFTGAVAYPNLPEYIAAMDLGLIPLAPPQWVDIALPNKYFEYSACEKPILTTPIPDVLALGGDHLRVYRNRAEFIQQVDTAIRDPVRCTLDMTDHDWQRKATAFETIFARVLGGRR